MEGKWNGHLDYTGLHESGERSVGVTLGFSLVCGHENFRTTNSNEWYPSFF